MDKTLKCPGNLLEVTSGTQIMFINRLLNFKRYTKSEYDENKDLIPFSERGEFYDSGIIANKIKVRVLKNGNGWVGSNSMLMKLEGNIFDIDGSHQYSIGESLILIQ